MRIAGTSINPQLLSLLWRDEFDVYISGIVGRFALPATYAVARARRRPFVLWSNIWMRIQTPAHRIFFPATRYLYRHADAIVAGGEHVKRYLVSEGASALRIFSCGNATDNRLYARAVSAARRDEVRSQLGVGASQRIVLYIGRLEEAKGLHYLIEAFASLPHAEAVLVIAGSGDDRYRRRLERQAAQSAAATRIRFTGFIPNRETPDYYAVAWVYVLPSITTSTFKEPWGLVIHEAFGQGVPVIATDSVGAVAGGMLRDDVEGLVVPERDAAALARAMDRVLSDPELRHRLGAAARATVQRWDIERMVSGFRDAITHVLR